MAETFPLVIASSRSVTLGGVRSRQDRLVAELETQSLADVRAYVRQLTREAQDEQLRAGNPATLMEVDGKTDKALEQVSAKTVTVFGVVLAQAAMREIELALAAAIDRSTRARTGRLRDTAASWQWRFLPAGGAPRTVTASSDLTFNRGDRLVLVPAQVPYATLVNRAVARSGRANLAPRKGKAPAKSRQNRGFLFHAADAVRRRSSLAQFHVKVVFTRAHMVPGELMTDTSGTGVIQLSARVRRV